MRKNILVLALLFCIGFSLPAQSRTGSSIYVLPVMGIGGRPEDNSLFYRQIVFELTDQNYNIARTQEGADYSLIGMLAPFTDIEQFVFNLRLQDNKTGETNVEGELVYEVFDDVNQQFLVLLTTILYTIPEDTGQDYEWRDKLIYLGAALTWTPRVYIGDSNSTYFGDPHGGISAEYHFLDFLSVEMGIELAADKLNSDSYPYSNTMIEIPLLVKGVLKPGDWFMLEPYAGFYFNIPLLSGPGTTKPPWFSWMAGIQYGVKAICGRALCDGYRQIPC